MGCRSLPRGYKHVCDHYLFYNNCIIVAMATRLLNLQGVLFLNHNTQWLLLKYDDDRYLYQSTKVAKN